jgi:head-tail adaptor
VKIVAFGKMNQFIDIIQTVQIKDTAGFAVWEDTVLASVRAYREDRHGNKTWANRAAFSTASVMFRFRNIPGLNMTPALNIVSRGERFNILSVENVRGKGMYWEVFAEHIEPSKG